MSQHHANGTLNLTSGLASIKYDLNHPGWNGNGQYNGNFSAMKWHDRTTWIRKNEASFDTCCAACVNATGCRAWTIVYDGSSGQATCHLASSTATAYPNTKAISGYPLKADPASYCEQLWLSGHGKIWMDEEISNGIACANAPSHFPNAAAGSRALAADSRTAAVNADDDGDASDKEKTTKAEEEQKSGFPPSWRDKDGKQRGASWLFFPEAPPAPSPQPPHGHQDRPDHISGEWTGTGLDRYAVSPASNGGGDSQIRLFKVACLSGGPSGDCDPVHPGHNGSAWHASTLRVDLSDARGGGPATVQASYDNLHHTNGTFENKGLTRIKWSDGSLWHKVGKCACHCPNGGAECDSMRCSGPAITPVLEQTIISGKPWVVYRHLPPLNTALRPP